MGAPERAARAEPLSRDRILDAASALLSDEGARVFSMRRLAARLGVTPMALYKWFDSRDALLSALTERVLDVAVSAAEDLSVPWPDRVLTVARALRGHMLEHRQLLQLVGAPRRLSGLMAVTSDRLLGLMLERGFNGGDAVEAYRIVFWSVISHCTTVDAGDAMPALAADYDGERAVQNLIDSAGVELPSMRTLQPFFAPVAADDFFETAIRAVVDGLDARIPH